MKRRRGGFFAENYAPPEGLFNNARGCNRNSNLRTSAITMSQVGLGVVGTGVCIF
jgi:hypothetical protein